MVKKISAEDSLGRKTIEDINKLWKKKPFLPVILNSTNGDLNQAFLIALNDALVRAELVDLIPDTYYSIALKRISNWEKEYPETFNLCQGRILCSQRRRSGHPRQPSHADNRSQYGG